MNKPDDFEVNSDIYAYTLLAQHDDHHFVAYIIHSEQVCFNWRRIQIQMTPDELLEVADFLQEIRPQLETNSLRGNAHYCVIQDDRNNFEVWLLGVGLYLKPDEFEHIINLTINGSNAIRARAKFGSSNEILH
ncbi:MAG: hypothetical protein AAF485_10785 [Chloroflexota bacterium]